MASFPFGRASSSPSSRDSLLKTNSPSPPFPKRQMLVLAICRICEPIAFMGIFPYVYFMIEDFHITNDKDKISFYAGMVTSAFTFAEFSTGLLWSRLSDRIGRKPVLLTGFAGTALSVLIFGFARNIWVALAARAVGGLLNGNMGVLQSTVAELVTVKEHQPRAYTIMPLVWCIGSIVGPMIGGALARPCTSYPNLFPPGSIWETYPYLLPNLFSAFVVLIAVVNGLLFLEETHSERKTRHDRGLELGDWLLSRASWLRRLYGPARPDATLVMNPETRPLLAHDEQLPGYHTREASPQSSPRLMTTSATDEPQGSLCLSNVPRFQGDAPPKIFTESVILNVVAFGILAFHTMTFDSMFPTFLSTKPPTDRQPTSLPFKFVDGFGLDTKTIGIILSAQGAYSLLINMFLVPVAIQRLGPLRLFRLLSVTYFLLYLVTSYIVLLPERYRMTGICLITIWKCTFANMAYPSNAILIANSAPSQHALGTINGVAASTASLCRTFGPTISGLLFSVGLKTGYSGLPWWCIAIVTIAGAFVAARIPEQRVMNEKTPDDVEAAQQSPSIT